MKLETLFRKCIESVREEGAEFAVCGGLAAQMYRAETRVTVDIDILISAKGREVEIATRVIESFGLSPTPLRTFQLSSAPASHKRSSPIEVIVGRNKADKTAFGLDFLLPRQGWTENALRRAQVNTLQIDGVGAPFVTAEDMLLAKFTSAMLGGTRRLKDLDDIISMMDSRRSFDLAYVAAEIDRLKLSTPPDIEKLLPKALSIPLKRNRLSKRKGQAK